MKRKLISAVMAAMLFSAMSVSFTAFAEDSSAEAAETTEIAETEDSTADSDDAAQDSTELTEDAIIEDILDDAKDIPPANDDNKYYTDDYFDTEGNATLIKEEQVIYESEEMQFIAVTTKSGDVFYILINYSAASDENNVYFLNKVDTLDLYALLYMTDDEEENGIDVKRVKRAEDAYFDNASMYTVEDETSETAEDTTEDADTAPAKPASGMNITLLLGVGIVALIAVGFVGFKMLKKKPSAKNEADFDEPDEDELNEDEDF